MALVCRLYFPFFTGTIYTSVLAAVSAVAALLLRLFFKLVHFHKGLFRGRIHKASSDES